MIVTMELTKHDSAGKPYSHVCIVTLISVQPRKPIGVKAEVETLCGEHRQIKGAVIKMHYDTRYPVATCVTCNDRHANITV